MRKILRWLLFFCFAAIYPSRGEGATLRSGFQDIGPSVGFLWVAEKQGFYQKKHLHADAVYLRGRRVGIQALLGDSVDITTVGGEVAMRVSLQSGEAFVFASYVNVLTYQLAATPEINEIVSPIDPKNEAAFKEVIKSKMKLEAGPVLDYTYKMTAPIHQADPRPSQTPFGTPGRSC